MDAKISIRSVWQEKLAEKQSRPKWGKAAEKLRRLASYRKAKTVFATPHESIQQARINCIADGKNLLMPGPGLRDGFFLVEARSVPFKDITLSVTYKGLEKYGRIMKDTSLSQLSVDLLLTDALAVDQTGGRIGNGQGYFDLCCALLQEMSSINPDAEILAVISDEQVSQEKLPQEKWDIIMSGVITPSSILQFGPSGRRAKIYWDKLTMDRIKRIDPLWKLFQKRNDGLKTLK